MINSNHPGFLDPDYKLRRNEIANSSQAYITDGKILDINYSSQENYLWKQVRDELRGLHIEKAVTKYLRCYENFPLPGGVMQLAEVNLAIKDNYFEFIPASGLYPPTEFFRNLSDRKFVSTQYIRHHSVPYYTPEPDIIHEIFGHAILFLDNEYSNLNQLFGEVAMYAAAKEIEELIRLYWYTIEFGLCYEDNKLKTYGAGLLSSVNELGRIEDLEIREFNIEEMKKTDFNTMHYQPFLFCAENYEFAIKSLNSYLKSRLDDLCQRLIYT